MKARDGPSDPNALAKWRILNRLHDRNETMYYKVCASLCTLLYEPPSVGTFLVKR